MIYYTPPSCDTFLAGYMLPHPPVLHFLLGGASAWREKCNMAWWGSMLRGLEGAGRGEGAAVARLDVYEPLGDLLCPPLIIYQWH